MTASARAASTRRQLLDAARDAFEQDGYRATTVAGIVQRADTARGTFYLYFRNKEHVFAQLVGEVVDDLLHETSPSWPAAMPPRPSAFSTPSAPEPSAPPVS